MAESKLKEKLNGIIDGYYGDSADYKDLIEVLEEVEFLYTRNILIEKGLGRTHDIVKHALSVEDV